MFTNLCCWYILNESIRQEESILENQDKKTGKKKIFWNVYKKKRMKTVWI